MENPSFIGIYDNVLSHEQCQKMITKFEDSPKQKGQFVNYSGPQIDPSVKSSLEPKKSCRFSNEDLYARTMKQPLIKCIDQYYNQYQEGLKVLSHWTVDDAYPFKKFTGKNDGYKKWHIEHGLGKLRRVLAWSFYLNDASGTDFKFYPTVEAKEGRCVIFPAYFTHVHKSAENLSTKYIVSGWLEYITPQETAQRF